jgi:hypothetical protein
MSSGNGKNERLKTFRRRYSLEYIIMLEVMRRFTDIYEDIYPNAPYAPPTLIEFEVHRDVKTGKPMLGIPTEDGMFACSINKNNNRDHVISV